MNNYLALNSIQEISNMILNVDNSLKQTLKQELVQSVCFMLNTLYIHQKIYIQNLLDNNAWRQGEEVPMPFEGDVHLSIEELKNSCQVLSESVEHFSKLMKHTGESDECNDVLINYSSHMYYFCKNVKDIMDFQKYVYTNENDPLSLCLIKLRNVLNLVMTVSDNAKSRNLCTIAIANLIFRIYFYINSIKLDLFNVLDNLNLDENSFEEKDLCIYYYLRGSIELMNKKYSKGADYIDKSYNIAIKYNCFEYLKFIAEKLLLLNLMRKKQCIGSFIKLYKLDRYIDLIKAVNTGNIQLFDEYLRKHEMHFIKSRVWILVLSLRVLVFLQLMKKACKEYFVKLNSKQVKIELLTDVFRKVGLKVDKDEVIGYVMHLIQCGQIRAYISLDHGIIVFDKTVPFDEAADILRIY